MTKHMQGRIAVLGVFVILIAGAILYNCEFISSSVTYDDNNEVVCIGKREVIKPGTDGTSWSNYKDGRQCRFRSVTKCNGVRVMLHEDKSSEGAMYLPCTCTNSEGKKFTGVPDTNNDRCVTDY